MTSASRRKFVLGYGAVVLAAGAGAGSFVSGCKSARSPDEVSPSEDLMREHGVLNRILLVYEEGIRRIGAQEELPADTLARSADLVSRFIEQYHEKLEEDFLFPRFEKANKLVDLVKTLRAQHQAGRDLTATIQRLANVPTARAQLSDTMQRFIRMYRPHEAREDTVLFPALPSVISAKELEDLGERFEDKEHELFGKEGFEGIVEQVAALERTLNIHDLNQFTPRVT
jgi:hemerythrin-like domain-containing protein